ncbi:MAG: hypothetical protein JRJ03_14310 [Deltaproteobacteria bacterium]|nr:hypothetical protein [Deltaproteobacteria bacterium]
MLFRKLPSIEELEDRYGFIDDEYTGLGLPGDELGRYDPGEVLKRIYEWWGDEKEEYLPQYERRTYPEDFWINLEPDEYGRIHRKSWLILLTLSHFHTMGRPRDVQHRGFIGKCIVRGWWDVFSDEHPERRADEWMEVLEEYISEQVDITEYEHWMNHFPAIYRFSRWLTDYSELFLSIDRMGDNPNIRGLLKPRTHQDLQGGGINAPPIERSLGIGACFVVRELKRKQILKGDSVVPFCYVPVKRVRKFLGNLGCEGITENGEIADSKRIYRFLRDNLGEQGAGFFGSYDIPLQVIADSKDLLRMIL